MTVFKRGLWATGFLVAMTADALAYGGPGAAITLIGSLIGVGLAIFASLFYVILWPLRRMFKKRKAGREAEPATETATAATVTAGNTGASQNDGASAQTTAAGDSTAQTTVRNAAGDEASGTASGATPQR